MMKKKRKILYISGTRADYGLMRETLFSLQKNLDLELEIIVTGMHLMPEFGNTVQEIIKDGFKIHQIKAVYKSDNKESMVDFIGELILLLNKAIKKIKPDIILLLGDRAEMLAAATVASYLGIPVAHIHGGDKSSTIDDIARHAITKLSHIHFPATKKSAERIIKMGEDKKRVFITGAPGLDAILHTAIISKNITAKKYGLDVSLPIILVVQHPVTIEINDAKIHMQETMSAIKELGYQAIVVYPNADAGGREMIKVIETYRKYSFIKIYKSISRIDFLSLMKIVDAMVGNSSSGVIETALFHLPVINIGTRQQGRERSENVIDADYKKEAIKKAITKALYDKHFIKKVKKAKNPYGDGKTGARIAKILSSIKISHAFLEKKLTY